MAIEVSCPGCGKILYLADHVAGKKGKCPACGMVMEIPKDQHPPVLETVDQGPSPLLRRLSRRQGLAQLIAPVGGSAQFIRKAIWWGVGLGALLCLLGFVLVVLWITDLAKFRHLSDMPISEAIGIVMFLILPLYAALWVLLTGHLYIVVSEIRDFLKSMQQ